VASVDAIVGWVPGSGAYGSVYTKASSSSTLGLAAADPQGRFETVLAAGAYVRRAGDFPNEEPSLITSVGITPEELPYDDVGTDDEFDSSPTTWTFLASGWAEAHNPDHDGTFNTSKPTYLLEYQIGVGCSAEDEVSLNSPGPGGSEYSNAFARASSSATTEAVVSVSVLDD